VHTQNLARWFLRGHDLNPDGVALRVGTVELTYRELLGRAQRLAAGIREVTDSPAPRVGILAGQSVPAYEGVLATALCGGTIVPLNAGFPAGRLVEMARAAGVRAVVADEAGHAARQRIGQLGALPVARPSATTHNLPPDGDGIAYILFTSGTTGRPKGVPIGNAQVDHYLRVIHDRYRFTTSDIFSQTFDLTFDLAMFDLFAAWGAGGTLVSVPPTVMAALPGYLAQHGITVWFSAPSAIALARRWRQLSPGALPTLRWSLFCGEPLLGADAAEWQAAAPQSTLENLYGPTELTISCTVHRWDPATSPARCVNGIVPIGVPHPGMRAVLADEQGNLTGGDTGELCMSGPQTTPGYLDPADDTHRFFEFEGERWYRTGDLVRFDSRGELLYLGRRDSQVQVRGCRIELAEIDHAVTSRPGVEQAVTVHAAGELVTFYTGASFDRLDLARELAHILPHNMIPKLLRHVPEFPLNPNRKIDRTGLRMMADEALAGAGAKTAKNPAAAEAV
jgi:amino acid adenylation domain-containing protein